MGNTAKLKYYWPQSCYELKTNKRGRCRGLQSAIVSRGDGCGSGAVAACARAPHATAAAALRQRAACGAALAQQSARMLPLQLCCPCAANCGAAVVAAAATHATRRAKIRCLVIL